MASQAFLDLLEELLEPIGSVQFKRMFGGAGLFYQGLMFALVADDSLYLKVDEELKRVYQDLGLQPFEFVRQGKSIAMSYFSAPAEVLENPDAMQAWAGRSIKAAIDLDQIKAERKKKSPKKSKFSKKSAGKSQKKLIKKPADQPTRI